MDCTPICRLPKHAELILCAATREKLPEFRSVSARICSNAGNVTDKFGRHLLHVAVSCGKADILEWLLEEGKADIGLRDRESGWTPLHRALYYGQLRCAVKLLEHGADLYALDKEELSPLDLAMLDCPYKMANAAEARVVNEYKTSLDDELNLMVGDVIENVRLSDMSINYWIGSLNGKRGFFPKNSVELVRQDYRTVLYTWGSNTNFTLGHCDENTRAVPELVELSSDKAISLKQVVMCKFHSVFLTDDGRVYTCGHGRGGRLGHGDEKTQLSPQHVKGLDSQKCIGIAAAQDHTVVAMETGDVFSFGLNDKQQLGHSPPPAQCLLPRMVQVKSWKGRRIVGVAAGQYHTVFYTETEVFTCGLNIGQLGHIKGDKFQVAPRQVTGLLHKEIKIASVVCTDAATVCSTIKGDVYILSNYTCHKVINRFPELAQLAISGGEVDVSTSQDLNKVNEKLTLVLLDTRGTVHHWKMSYGGTKKCHWSLNRDLVVTDVTVGKSLYIVTDRGEAFTCIRSDDHLSGSKRKDVIGYKVARIPMVHRGVRIFTDLKSRGCAVLQIDPSTGLDERPRISDSRMHSDLKQLLEEASLDDNIHDVVLMVGAHEFPAHFFILASRSTGFRDVIATRFTNGNSTERAVKLDNVKDYKIVIKYLQDLYGGSEVDDTLLFPEHSNKKRRKNKQVTQETPISGSKSQQIVEDEEELENRDPLLTSLVTAVGNDLDDLSVSAINGGGDNREHETSSPRQKKNRKNKVKTSAPEKERRPSAKALRKEVQTRDLPRKKVRFSRKNCPEYHDVTIESEDEVHFPCHKCVLVARLDYFRSMLACGWLEASREMTTLKMPLHSSVLAIVLDYLYTDEAGRIQGCEDVEFIGNVLVVADQLLIGRLKEICESVIAKLILSKNVMELLEFACVYNAKQLKNACLEFICCNLNSLLESGYFSLLSEDTLEELTKAYKQAIPNMAWRIITPEDDYLAELAKEPYPNPSKKRRSSNRKKSSRSVSEGDGEIALPSDEIALRGEEEAVERKMSELLLEEVFDDDDKGSVDSTPLSPLPNDDEEKLTSTESDQGSKQASIDGLWYKKEYEMETGASPRKTKISNKQKEQSPKSHGSSTATEHKAKDGLSNEQAKDIPHKTWGLLSSVSSPPSCDLRGIIEQEQHAKQAPNQSSPAKLVPNQASPTQPVATGPTSPRNSGKAPPRNQNETESYSQNMAIKWESGGKQSQKQRKKARSTTQENISPVTDNTSEPKPSEAKPNPWGSTEKNPTPVRSLRDLIEQEKQTQPKRQDCHSTRTASQSSTATGRKSSSKKKLSWSLLSSAEEKKEQPAEEQGKPIEPSSKNAWGSPPQVAGSPPTGSAFADILHSQEREDINLDRARKKPLSQIQLEDRAMQELLEHYGGPYNACEFVTVERIPVATATPVWHRERSSSASGKS